MTKSLSIIYDLIISGVEITRKTFLNENFTNEEIDHLISSGLFIVHNDQYKLKQVEGLYKYGVTLLINNHFGKANECFKICYEIDPMHRDTCMQLFLHALKNDYYYLAVTYFENILKIDSNIFRYDNNLYLYLLNYLEIVPEKHKKFVKASDFLYEIKEDSSAELKEELSIREKIKRNSLTLAMRELNDLIGGNLTYDLKKSVLKELLSKAISAHNKTLNTILDLVKQERYFDIVTMLKNIKKLRTLDKGEYQMLLLSEAIIKVIQTNEIPIITISNPASVSEAIKGNDFEKAIIIAKANLKRVNKPRKNDPLLVLLIKICGMINNIKLTKEANQELIEIPQDYSDSIESNTSIEELSDGNSYQRNLNDILFFMKEDNIPLEEVIYKYNLSQEEILLLKLLMAKDCNSLGFVTLGEKYLNEVKDDLNITDRVIVMLKEVTELFYQNKVGLTRKRVDVE